MKFIAILSLSLLSALTLAAPTASPANTLVARGNGDSSGSKKVDKSTISRPYKPSKDDAYVMVPNDELPMRDGGKGGIRNAGKKTTIAQKAKNLISKAGS
jgi:hypothetical protein